MAPLDEQLVKNLGSALSSFTELSLALLFGSQATGRADAKSDVDLAVVAPESILPAISAKVSDAVGREVDVVSLGDPTIPLLRELIRDSSVVYEKVPGQGALWRSRTLAQLEIDGPWYDRMRDAWLARVAERGFSDGQ